MKRIILVFTALLLILLTCACTTAEDILNDGLTAFIGNRKEKPVIMSDRVFGQLDTILTQYTAGTANVPSALPEDVALPANLSEDALFVLPSVESAQYSLHTSAENTVEYIRIDSNTFALGDFEMAEIMHSISTENPMAAMFLDRCSYKTTQTSGGSSSTAFAFHYSLPAAEVIEKKAQTQAAAQQIVDLLALGEKNDDEKVYAIVDYLCGNVEYIAASNAQPQHYTAYGALAEGAGCCDGFSRAAQLLLQMADIECIYVRGIMNGEAHSWVMVSINDTWYHCDVLCCKALSTDEFILVSDEYMQVFAQWDTLQYPQAPAMYS